MKLSIFAKFVDDNDHFAEYDVDDSYTKLIVILINKLNILDGEICEFSRGNKWSKIKFIKALNEYLNYNVEYFDDFTITSKLFDIGCGDIKMPINILKSLDDKCTHRMVVVGEPGELHYLLKENITLKDFVNDKEGLISFSMKSGEELSFIKNYINNGLFIREQYYPGSRIKAQVYDLKYLMENHNVDNKKVCTPSAFEYPEFFQARYLFEQIFVTEEKDGKYEIDIRDCDGRPYKNEIHEGDSLYSIYYQYMIDNRYFADNSKVKVKM